MASQVLTTGFVPDADAANLLACAEAVLIPSSYEGFGLPIVEAMACERPVVCSDIPAFREVAADAAEYVACRDASGWAQVLQRLAGDREFREQLGRKGRRQVDGYSWHTTSSRHAELMHELIHPERICRPKSEQTTAA